MTREARLFTVHGRVQGVWFRDSTRREAERLAIAGHDELTQDQLTELGAALDLVDGGRVGDVTGDGGAAIGVVDPVLAARADQDNRL